MVTSSSFFFPHQLHGDCMTITGKTIEENVTDSFAAYDALKKIPLGENASTSGRESPLTQTIVSCFSSGCYLYFCVRDYYYILCQGLQFIFCVKWTALYLTSAISNMPRIVSVPQAPRPPTKPPQAFDRPRAG